MERSDMIDCLVNYYADGNQAEFSRMLGLRPQSISEWKKRDRIDVRLVYKCCKEVSADWLLSDGEGEMIRAQEPQEPSPEMETEIKYLKALLEEKERTISLLLDRQKQENPQKPHP